MPKKPVPEEKVPVPKKVPVPPEKGIAFVNAVLLIDSILHTS